MHMVSHICNTHILSLLPPSTKRKIPIYSIIPTLFNIFADSKSAKTKNEKLLSYHIQSLETSFQFSAAYSLFNSLVNTKVKNMHFIYKHKSTELDLFIVCMTTLNDKNAETDILLHFIYSHIIIVIKM